MRLICPHCMSGVTVPDDAAGKEVTCSHCGKSFPTPARYAAAVVPEAPAVAGPIEPVRTSPHPEPPPMPPAVPPPAPPGFVPPPAPTPDGFLTSGQTSASVQAPAGYTHSFGITISPRIVSWLPAALLLFVLVLTFFPWVGCYAGGVPVYSQRPWTAVYGSVSPNYDLEKAVSIPPGWRTQGKVSSDWLMMVPYLLLLLLATALAWADRGLHALDPRNIPPLAKVWPHRLTVLCVLATLAFVLAGIQVSNGFGMERAIRKQVSEEIAEEHRPSTEATADQAKLGWQIDQKYDRYNLERTTWMYLALLFNLLAVLAVILRLGLDRRGNKPPPKILLHY